MNNSQRCVLVQQSMADFIAGSLSPFKTRQVKAHLQHCDICPEVLQNNLAAGIFHTQVGFRTRTIHTPLTPPRFGNNSQTMLRQWLENSFEPESHFVEAMVYEGSWPYANNDYY